MIIVRATLATVELSMENLFKKETLNPRQKFTTLPFFSFVLIGSRENIICSEIIGEKAARMMHDRCIGTLGGQLVEKAGSIFEEERAKRERGLARAIAAALEPRFIPRSVPAGVAVKVLAAVSDYFGRACRSEMARAER